MFRDCKDLCCESKYKLEKARIKNNASSIEYETFSSTYRLL